MGFYALDQYLQHQKGLKGIFLETAHPLKFPETVEAITGEAIPIPQAVQYLFERKKESVLMEASFPALKDWLLQHG